MSAALGLVAPLIELAEVISSQKEGATMTEILSLVANKVFSLVVIRYSRSDSN